jgi:hypothetical protein
LDKSALPVTEGFFPFYPSRRQNSAALRALIDVVRGDAFRVPANRRPRGCRQIGGGSADRRPAQPQAARYQRGETMLNKIASELAALAEQHIGQPLQAVANDWRERSCASPSASLSAD